MLGKRALLFTAFTEDENWKGASDPAPTFKQRAMHSYFDMILEVGDQLVAK